ncbi:hypothetical protein DERP_006483 [Dermatophagoides pteronyssinus]|uniref:Uncharacterized protein n=1 Tax=Dermatophagoides pteronyssinus TaxID=6956 RepID=A0ABQ8IQB1_DERPT|nr:hypothetical protein DERP_006483 [Dermatophagoides pteronyssinus]
MDKLITDQIRRRKKKEKKRYALFKPVVVSGSNDDDDGGECDDRYRKHQKRFDNEKTTQLIKR